MIRIQQIKLAPESGNKQLQKKAARLLGIQTEDIAGVRIVRQSIDARKKSQVQYVYTIDISLKNPKGTEGLVKRAASPHISLAPQEVSYVFPAVEKCFDSQPLIVGLGPAGLFAALSLARAGVPALIVERGKDIDARTLDVEQFWQTGQLSPLSNVQFGEGGAGTFSDGKLTTGTHDIRAKRVLQILVEHGAPKDILYSHKPHVGTDVLRRVVKSIRRELLDLGCEILFEHQLTDIQIEQGHITGASLRHAQGERFVACRDILLAVGHSARDTFQMLQEKQVPMEAKPFAIGVRIEHKQSAINHAQYGDSGDKMPPSDYKLVCHLPSGRSAFSFCVCPGGVVVAAASEAEHLVTNGMSYRNRDGENINGALLIGVNPSDFAGDDALAGVRYQEHWEKLAWEAGGRRFYAPAQLVGDFLAGVPSEKAKSIRPSYQPGVTFGDLSSCLPPYVIDSLKEALPLLDKKVQGFAQPDAVLTGVETRSSSPLRILRGAESLQSGIAGLYPCGEGAGYAGGIVSAAVDGIRVAEALVLA